MPQLDLNKEIVFASSDPDVSGEPLAYIKVMETLHRFGQTLYGRTTDNLLGYLTDCNAFKEPDEAKLRF